MKVTFLLPNEIDISRLVNYDLTTHWRLLFEAPHSWITQSYLRLKSTGYDVLLDNTIPQDGIVVFHAKDKSKLLKQKIPKNIILVCIRGDLHCSLFADFEILQNYPYVDNKKTFFIPHWSQPCLIPRNPKRESALTTLSFKGFKKNLHQDFRSTKWNIFLNEQDLEWLDDSTNKTGKNGSDNIDWHDYSEIDLIIAVRPPCKLNYTHKPPTKLYNAWLAGVPAILGPESAYQALRKSELDYIEASNFEEAQMAILNLKKNPDLYQAMVENGFQRAAEYTNEAITQQWAELLFNVIPRESANNSTRFINLFPRRTQRMIRKALYPLLGKKSR